MKSLFENLADYQIDKRTQRQKFIDEAFEKIVLERRKENYLRWKKTNITSEQFRKTKDFLKPPTVRSIAVRINMSCPDETTVHYFRSVVSLR